MASQPASIRTTPSAKRKSRLQGLFKLKGRKSTGLNLEDAEEVYPTFATDKSPEPDPPKHEDNLEAPKEKTGLFEWTSPCSDKDGIVDVIAVHGLNGDAHNTWQCGTKIWLRDFLPNQIPSLRVMSYGYDSHVLFSNSTADAEDFASQLLSRIRGKRITPEERARPIVFICHSLGGIVVKQALISAHERSDIHSNILGNTKGIVFMGTPHFGSNIANFTSILASLVSASTLGVSTNVSLLNGLKQNSESLAKISRQFTGRISNLKILTFYETKKITGLNQLIVSRNSALLNHHHETPCELDADHRSLCRFESIDCQNYSVVWPLIRELIEYVRPASPILIDVPLSEREQSSFASLMASLFSTSKSTTAIWNDSLRVDGTCTWILDHPRFIQWQAKTSSSNLLLVSAGPGCGKSVLASFMAKELETREPSTIVCSFFCYDKIDARKLLCNVIHQLLSKRRELARHAIKHWENKGEDFAMHWPTLCEIWKACCNDVCSGRIVLVIDALDECDEPSRLDLLGFLKPLIQQIRMSSDQNKLKVLITSRPEVDIVQTFVNVPVSNIVLESETENLPHDIECVIQSGVRDLIASGKIRNDKAQTLKVKLRNKAGGTFLWIGMIFKLLKSRMETRASEDLVDNLPEELSEVYGQLLDRIPRNQREKAKVALQLIIAARRPLTLSELDFLLSIQANHSSEKEVEDLASADPHYMINTLCGSFIRIVNEDGVQYVYLVHQTAKEYLLGNPFFGSQEDSTFWHCFSNIDCNMVLALRCIWFLLFIELEDFPLPKWSASEQNDFESHVQDYIENRTLLGYTAVHWPTHFRECESAVDSKTVEQALRLYNPGSRYDTWSQIYWGASPSNLRNFPPLHMCSHNGHARLLQELLKNSITSTKNAKDLDGGETPLHRAAEAGHVKAVEVLLHNEADVTIRDKNWLTALHKAAKANKGEAVKILVKGGANIDARLNDGSTSLHVAASDGLENMVRLLVDRGADVDITDRNFLTASDLAFNKGHGTIQKFLLEKQTDSGITLLDRAIIDGAEDRVIDILDTGADFHNKDSRGLSPLHRAARTGNVNIVDILIGRGAPKELADDNGATSLHVAAKSGNVEVVKTFITNKCNVNTKNLDGSTPLHEAVMSGSESVAVLLLQAGAGIDDIDDEGKTALFHSANLGYLSLLRTLRSWGANHSLKARMDRTPLHAAAEKGHHLIVKYLLEADTFRVDYKDQQGETALTLAARGASALHADVVDILIQNGADVCMKQSSLNTPIFFAAEIGNDQTIQYLLKDDRVNLDEMNFELMTPLLVAAKNGHENAILTLIDHGARSVNKTYLNRTPLSFAAEHGLEKAVKRILEFTDVDINDADDNGRTALSWAAVKGHLAVSRCLVKDERIEIDNVDENLRTPLSWAAQEGHENVTRLLLDRGSDPTRRDGEYGRAPISWAALNGHESIVQLLLEEDSDALLSSIDRARSTLLSLAAPYGREAMIRFLLARDDSNINQSNIDDATPLYTAAANGHEDVVRILLLNSSIEVNLRKRDGTTPLAIAATEGHEGIVRQLIAHHDIALELEDDNLTTPLSLAAGSGHETIVHILMERGANPHVLNRQKATPLHLAAEGGHMAAVSLLLSNLDQINARTYSGETPLWVSAAGGWEDVVKVLVSRLSASLHSEQAEWDHKDAHGRTPLFAAAMNGHVGTVRFLLEASIFDINSEDDTGHTPLLISLEKGHVDVAVILLEHGPKINVQDMAGQTPLLWACSRGRTDLIELVLQQKDVKRYLRDKTNSSPAHLACGSGSESAVRMILDAGTKDLNARNYAGKSPLSIAAEAGHFGIVQFLLCQDGIEPNLRDSNGNTPFSLAVKAGHEPIVRLLLDSLIIETTTKNDLDETPILIASSCGHTDILRLLIDKKRDQLDLEKKNIHGDSPLLSAALNGQLAAVQLLLSNGANPSILGGRGKSNPLVRAAGNGHYEIVKILLQQNVDIEWRGDGGQSALSGAAFNGYDDVVQLLLANGASPEGTPDLYTGRTPLMDAAFQGNEHTVRVLLACKNTNPDYENDTGRTALWYTCYSEERGQSSLQIFNMLFEHDIRPDSNDLLGHTPLMIAAERGEYEMARILLEKNADPELKHRATGNTAFSYAASKGSESIVRMLLDLEDPRIDPDTANLNNETPLTLAAMNGHEGVIKLLLGQKNNISLEQRRHSDGQTPLMCAARMGFESIIRLLLERNADMNGCDKLAQTPLILAIRSGSVATVDILIKNNAQLNVKDKNGTTPLMSAALEGHINSVRLLLGKIGITSRDRHGRTALSYAATNGHQEIVRLLIQEGNLTVTDINSKDKGDCTAATWAVKFGHASVLQFLSENGADLSIRDRNGRSLLSHAAEYDHLRTLRFLISQSQEQVNSQDQAGRTALSWAAERGEIASVRLLLGNGADMDIKDKKGKMPRSYAIDYDQKSVVQLLDSYSVSRAEWTESGLKV